VLGVILDLFRVLSESFDLTNMAEDYCRKVYRFADEGQSLLMTSEQGTY
jgi:hypothetical protein